MLTSSLYFVTQAHLSAAQLVLLGTGMAVTLTVSDIPAGVWSDAFSRKWPLVLGHGFLAAGMLLTGLVTAFPLLLLSQVLWALGWACSGGADVAWLTDELGQPDRIARVLTARARWARAVSVVWVNRRTPGPVRATVHSFLSQAETLGEILGGGTLAALARAAGIAATLLTGAALLAGTGALVARSRAR